MAESETSTGAIGAAPLPNERKRQHPEAGEGGEMDGGHEQPLKQPKQQVATPEEDTDNTTQAEQEIIG